MLFHRMERLGRVRYLYQGVSRGSRRLASTVGAVSEESPSWFRRATTGDLPSCSRSGHACSEAILVLEAHCPGYHHEAADARGSLDDPTDVHRRVHRKRNGSAKAGVRWHDERAGFRFQVQSPEFEAHSFAPTALPERRPITLLGARGQARDVSGMAGVLHESGSAAATATSDTSELIAEADGGNDFAPASVANVDQDRNPSWAIRSVPIRFLPKRSSIRARARDPTSPTGCSRRIPWPEERRIHLV